MEDSSDGIEIAGFVFLSNFDSANMSRVELVSKKPASSPSPKVSKKTAPLSGANRLPATKPVKSTIIESPDFEFNLWTNPDCSGTEFENSNRTWFYFGVRGGPPFSLVKVNIVDLNKQGRMYRDGMAPVYKVCPGRPWERVRDKPVYTVIDNVFTLSFKFRTQESPKAIMYFAFTYPFSYVELQTYLSTLDARMGKGESQIPKMDVRFHKGLKLTCDTDDNIYYHREVVCHSLEGRCVDLITISSHHNITTNREPRLRYLFPDESVPRPFIFREKKVVFVSARVHPGETPSSFVLNGLLNLLVSRDDPVGMLLRRQFVFKLIPMLNPDGVARGHYRTDTRGVNLNRYYLWPIFHQHPSIYAARSLIRFHHYGEEITDDVGDRTEPISQSDHTSCHEPLSSSTETLPLQDLSIKSSRSSFSSDSQAIADESPDVVTVEPLSQESPEKSETSAIKSGIFLYVDMHGHASKKGIFMYGNHFDRTEDSVECMLFPKVMSLNSQNFHFGSCNFTERNMYLRDKRGGTSKEGSGRVAVLRLTGTVRSYTLECNYNTGCVVNTLPQSVREMPGKPNVTYLSPPKYTPAVYEEIGRAIGVSLLDLTGTNPWSRIPNSEFHTLNGMRDWLRLRSMSENVAYQPNGSGAASRSKRHSQVVISLRPSRLNRVMKSNNRATVPLIQDNSQGKDTTAVPSNSQAKRPGPLRSLFSKNRVTEKLAKFKFPQKTTEESEPEKVVTVNTVSIGLNCPDASSKVKPTVSGELKQGTKRLKVSKDDSDSTKLKKGVWKKDASSDGQDGVMYSKLARPVSSTLTHLASTSDPLIPSLAKKRIGKPRTQLTPLKHKKSLEKRRNSDSCRKKAKILFKKASKLGLSSADLAKSENRKRRKNLSEH